MEDGQLEEFSIERTTEKNIVASVFKGKIKNLEPGLKAAFVDIGFEKNAFLHYWDIIPESLDQRVDLLEMPEARRANPSARSPSRTSRNYTRPARKSSCRSSKARSAQKARGSRPTSASPAVTLCSCRSTRTAASRARSRTTRNVSA